MCGCDRGQPTPLIATNVEDMDLPKSADSIGLVFGLTLNLANAPQITSESLAEVKPEIDAVLIDKKEKEAFALLTEGWEEAISTRYNYLKEMHEVYDDDNASELNKQQRLLAINEKYKKSPAVIVRVAMLAKEVSVSSRGSQIWRVFSGPEAAKYPFSTVDLSQNGFLETYIWKGGIAGSKEELSKKRPAVVGDLVLTGVSMHPISTMSPKLRGSDYLNVPANPVKDLEKFKGFKMKRDTVRDKVDTGFPDLAQWSLYVPNHFTYAGKKEELLVKVLTDEEKELLSTLRLDAYFEMLTEKYGLEVYARD